MKGRNSPTPGEFLKSKVSDFPGAIQSLLGGERRWAGASLKSFKTPDGPTSYRMQPPSMTSTSMTSTTSTEMFHHRFPFTSTPRSPFRLKLRRWLFISPRISDVFITSQTRDTVVSLAACFRELPRPRRTPSSRSAWSR